MRGCNTNIVRLLLLEIMLTDLSFERIAIVSDNYINPKEHGAFYSVYWGEGLGGYNYSLNFSNLN